MTNKKDKKKDKKKANKKNIKTIEELPFVSICTPTYNRRPFIPCLIKCFENQKYPKNKIEWIIVDDGTDKIEDLVTHIPQVKYFKLDEKITLGHKRNLLHSKCTGDIIVNMDDDDYYPPERIKHAVNTLLSNEKILCVGSSEMYIYFNDIKKMYQSGPYGPNHCTAATMAYKKELLLETKYNEIQSLAEEKQFLKDYKIPLIQLDPLQTILVFSHNHNTVDKKNLIGSNNKYFKESTKQIDFFINNDDDNKEIKQFFLIDMNNKLDNYDIGKTEHKIDVINQIEEINQTRKNNNIVIGKQNKNDYTKEELILLLNNADKILLHKDNEIKNIINEFNLIKNKLLYYENKYSKHKR
jgi:glycosyltransferase involved in cell wall biosynthesis